MLKRLPFRSTFFIFLLTGVLGTLFTAEGEAQADRSDSQFSAENGSQKAEVRVHYRDRKVTVKVLDQKNVGLPNSIQVSLFDKNGKRTDLELSAISIPPPSGESAFNRDYRGVIPATQNSFVGVSIKIPFSKAKTPPSLLEVGVPPSKTP